MSTFKQSLAAGYKQHKLALVAFAVITPVTLLIFYAPVISSDDWSGIIGYYIFGKMQWLDWTIRRPLEFTAYKLFLTIFGVDIPALYAINILLLFLNAFLLYWMIQDLLPDRRYLAFATGLIYLFYPADYTRMWLMMLSHHLAWLLVLLSFILLIGFARKGHVVSLVCALLLFTLALGEYEGQLGVMVAFCLLLVAIFWRKSWKRRLALLSPLLIAMLFVIWRVGVQPALKVTDPYISEIGLSPTLLVQRITSGFKVLLLSWTAPFLQFLNVPYKSKILFTLLGLVVILFALAAYVIFRKVNFKNRDTSPLMTIKMKRQEIKRDIFLFLAGFGLLVAGYLPVISIYEPNLQGVVSRVNFYAIPGAALVIVALLDLGALFLAKRVQQLRAMVPAGAIPLLLVGMVTQMLVQNASRQAWDEQKDLWTRLFEIAPNLTDRTGVIFVLPGYKNLGFAKNPPFVASWEVNWGMKVLYNNPHIFGAFYYPDINVDGEAEMLAGGVLIENEAAPIPYDKTVFVQYDQVTRHLKLLAQPGQDLQLPFTVQEYNSDQNILFAQLDTYQYRYLVAR